MREGDCELVGVPEGVPVGVPVLEAVLVGVPLAVGVPLLVPLGEAPADSEGVGELDTVGVGVGRGVWYRGAVAGLEALPLSAWRAGKRVSDG